MLCRVDSAAALPDRSAQQRHVAGVWCKSQSPLSMGLPQASHRSRLTLERSGVSP
jgi:hypothetical protein